MDVFWYILGTHFRSACMGPRLQAKIFLRRASQIFKFKDSDESCLADSESAVNLAIMSLTLK